MTISAKAFAIFALFLIPNFAFSYTASQQAQLDALDAQINQLKNQIYQQDQAQQSLNGEINGLNAQISAVQLELNRSNAEISALNDQIAQTNTQIAKAEADLAKAKSQLSEIVRVMYEDGQVSNIELIAKSKSFSEFVDRNEYIETMSLKIKETSDQVLKLKNELESKKKLLTDSKTKSEQLRASQAAQRSAIASQQSYKNYLLSNSLAVEKTLSSQKDAFAAKKRRLSASFGESVLGGTSGYPYGNPPPDSIIDTRDAYGYLIGECTSYSAWKRTAIGRPVPRNLGNANTWGTRAASQGYEVDQVPAVGDVMVFPYLGYYGHVAIVEAVYGNGIIRISEYNWIPYSYSARDVNPYNYGAVFIH